MDGLILSTLSYVRFQELVPDSPSLSVPLQQAAEAFLALPEQEAEDRVRCRHDLPLLKALLSAPRFASLPLTFYQDCLDPEREMQFSALTVLLDTGEALLVFRGTDNTLVGWKEDFNLSFLEVVPAQSAALNYTARLAAARPGPLLLAGHSKGGNLAVFFRLPLSPGAAGPDWRGIQLRQPRLHSAGALRYRVSGAAPPHPQLCSPVLCGGDASGARGAVYRGQKPPPWHFPA